MGWDMSRPSTIHTFRQISNKPWLSTEVGVGRVAGTIAANPLCISQCLHARDAQSITHGSLRICKLLVTSPVWVQKLRARTWKLYYNLPLPGHPSSSSHPVDSSYWGNWRTVQAFSNARGERPLVTGWRSTCHRESDEPHGKGHHDMNLIQR